MTTMYPLDVMASALRMMAKYGHHDVREAARAVAADLTLAERCPAWRDELCRRGRDGPWTGSLRQRAEAGGRDD